VETNPTYPNLWKTEKEAQFGALTTDFSMIRAGAIHKANGGYLIIPVEELLRNPFSYDGLNVISEMETLLLRTRRTLWISQC